MKGDNDIKILSLTPTDKSLIIYTMPIMLSLKHSGATYVPYSTLEAAVVLPIIPKY